MSFDSENCVLSSVRPNGLSWGFWRLMSPKRNHVPLRNHHHLSLCQMLVPVCTGAAGWGPMNMWPAGHGAGLAAGLSRQGTTLRASQRPHLLSESSLGSLKPDLRLGREWNSEGIGMGWAQSDQLVVDGVDQWGFSKAISKMSHHHFPPGLLRPPSLPLD